MTRWRSGLVLPAVLLTAVAGAAGGWAGVSWGLRAARPSPGLDRLLHHDLRLTADQTARLRGLEATYVRQRTLYEDEMRAADHDLAQAIVQDRTYDVREAAAIGRIHAAMGAEQEATVRHILAMRAVLTPAQAARFDRVVVRALSPPAP